MTKLKAFFEKVGAREREDFYGFLARLVDSGFDIMGASGAVADTLERQANTTIFGKGKLLAAAKLYRHVESEQRKGTPLHEALAGKIPDSEVMMLMAGAEGSIINGLNAAKKEAESSAKIKESFIKGLMYPAGVSALVIFAINWLGSNLLPTLTMLKPIEKWSSSEQDLYWITTNVAVWLPFLLIGLAGLIGGIVAINQLVVGSVRERIHSIPPFNVIRKTTAATYLSTLSSLVQAGSTMQGALNQMGNSTKSSYLRHYIDIALNNWRAGLASQGPGKAIGSPLFSPWVMVKLDIYSRGSSEAFAETMGDIANDARDEAVATIGGLSKLINTLIMIIAAGIIGFTIITMYGITGSLQGGI